MTSPSSIRFKSRFAFLSGIAIWAGLALSGTAASDRPPVSEDYRIPHARFSADLEIALRNGSRKETAVVCGKIRDRGGFPEWLIEYGRLLLDSCPEKAVLFTGSLADTDSVLFWQSVHGYRRDVAVLPMGFLDRLWFTDSVRREHGLSMTPEAGNASDQPAPPGCAAGGYSKEVLACFLYILRSNVKSRPLCLSMDLSPHLLRRMLPDLRIHGFIFQYQAFRGDYSEADVTTHRLLLHADGFRGIAGENQVRSDLDSLRSHYRFVAEDFLLRSGNRLRPAERNRLIALIHGPFSPYTVDAGPSVSRFGIGGSPQEH